MKIIIKWGKESGLFRLILKMLFLATFFVCLFTFIFGIKYQTGNNMYPKVEDGDLILTFRLEKPELNDLVVYKTEDGKTKIGRIVAMPNETVEINQKGELIVNTYKRTEQIFYPTKQGKYASKTYKNSANSYFILNDFRSDLDDSRTYGAISSKNIEGKAIFVIRHRGF